MRPPGEDEAAREGVLLAAERALASGRLQTARERIDEAARLGVPKSEVQRLRKAVKSARQAQDKRSKRSIVAGFALGVLLYLLLSIQQPTGWGLPVWIGLAFVVVPGGVGYLTGRWQGPEQSARHRFGAALLAAGSAMASYTGVWLLLLRSRLQSGGDAGQIFLLWLVVTGLYAAAAGVVAGAVSAWLTWRGAPGDPA